MSALPACRAPPPGWSGAGRARRAGEGNPRVIQCQTGSRGVWVARTRGCRPGRCARCPGPSGRAGTWLRIAGGSSPSRLPCQHGCRPKRAGRLEGHASTHTCSPPSRRPCGCRACPERVPGPAPGSWPLGQGEAGAGPERLQPGSRELPRQHTALSRAPGMDGHLHWAPAPRAHPGGGAETGQGRWVFSGSCGGNTPGGPSGASKPKSPVGRVPLDQSAAAPGACTCVGCRDSPRKALQLGGGHGVLAVYTGRRARWVPLLMFTCVSGSGVPARCPPRESLRGGSSPGPAPHAPRLAAARTRGGHGSRHAALHAHPPQAASTFFSVDASPPARLGS